MERATVIISRAGDGFGIEMVPPVAGVNTDLHFETHRAAYGFAAGLRMTNGCRIDDRTEARHVR